MIGPLDDTIIGSAFPFLRDVKKLALSWHNDLSGHPLMNSVAQI